MPRKKVTRLRKTCGQLAGHSRQQAERSTQAALELIRPWLPEGEQELDLLGFQLYVGERLEADRHRLTEIDDQHMHTLQVARDLREERDAAKAELREALFELKDGLKGTYGAGGAGKIFEEAPRIPNDPVALHQFSGHLIANLGNDDFPMPRPLLQSFQLDRKAAVLELRAPYRRLGAALRELERAESEVKYRQATKNTVVHEVETFANKVARFQKAFYALVGLDGLAQRVRRSSHRRTANAPEPDDGPTIGTAPGATASSSTASSPTEPSPTGPDATASSATAGEGGVPEPGSPVASQRLLPPVGGERLALPQAGQPDGPAGGAPGAETDQTSQLGRRARASAPPTTASPSTPSCGPTLRAGTAPARGP